VSVPCGDKMRLVSGQTGEKLRELCIETGAEISDSAESPEGDKERESACGTVDLVDSLSTGRDSWAEVEDGEESGSACLVLGIQACSLFRESAAAHDDVAAKVAASTGIGTEYDVPLPFPGGRVAEGEVIIPTMGRCTIALLSSVGSFMTKPGQVGHVPTRSFINIHRSHLVTRGRAVLFAYAAATRAPSPFGAVPLASTSRHLTVKPNPLVSFPHLTANAIRVQDDVDSDETLWPDAKV
jgi:hypothetical protein